MNYPEDFIDKIILGDCLEVMKSIPDKSIDLIITSPPYDRIRDYKGFKLDLDSAGLQVSRILKDGGICVMVIQDQTKDGAKTLTSFKTIVSWCQMGLSLWECCIYRRSGTPGIWWNARFRVDHEYIPIFIKGKKPQYFNKDHMKIPAKQAGYIKKGKVRKTDGTFTDYVYNSQRYPALKCPGTILDYEKSRARDKNNKLKTRHPAWFPDDLASDFIRCFSLENMIVLDPFVGSGTVARMAKKLNRRFIGIDLSKEYCDIANASIIINCVNILS